MTEKVKDRMFSSAISLLNTIDGASDAIRRLRDIVENDEVFSKNFGRTVDLIAKGTGRLVVCGVGKSGHIGRKISATMASTGTPAFFVHPTEASHGDLGMITASDILLLLSWSGDTVELANVLTYAKRFTIPVIGICSQTDSALGRHAEILMCLPPVKEACPNGLAPTTSTLLQLLLGDALAIALLERRGFTSQEYKVFHPGGKLGAQLKLIGELAHKGDKMPIVLTGTPMSEAILVMSSKGFGVIGVIDTDGRIVGIITDGDLRRHMSTHLLSDSVDDVMTLRPHVVSETKLAAEVLQSLESSRITVAFVVDDEYRPIGVVHVHDLLRVGVA